MPGHQIVEPVVVDPRQPVSSVGVYPDPLGKGLLDLPELFFGRLGRLDVEDAALDSVLGDGVVDLWRGTVQRVVQQQSGMAPWRAPFGRAGGRPREPGAFDTPGRAFGRGPDPGLRFRG